MVVLLVVVLVSSYGSLVSTRALPSGSRRVIAPSQSGKNVIDMRASAGLRVLVKSGKSYRLNLPTSATSKKVEICQRSGTRDKCRTLVGSVQGSSVQIQIPPLRSGAAYLKVTERSADGKTVGRELSRSTLAVQPSSSQPGDVGGSGGGGGGSGGSGGGGGGDRGSQRTTPVAEFVLPFNGETVTAGTTLDVRVKLLETSSRNLRCQQWILDGVTLTLGDWANGQSPDASAGPCL